MKRWHPIFLYLLIAAVLFTASVVYANNDEIKRRQRELENFQKQIKALDEQIKNNKNQQSELNRKIDNANYQMRTLETEIGELDVSIKVTEDQIWKKTTALTEAQEELAENNILLNERLVSMYKAGTVGYAEVLFGAKSFTDLLTRIDMVKLILEQDQQLIVRLKQEQEAIEQAKKELEEKKNELTTLFKSKLGKQDELKTLLMTLIDYKRTLSVDAEALEELERGLQEEADNLTKIIENMKLSAQYVGGEIIWPVPGVYEITSPFGFRIHPILRKRMLHTGIDIGCFSGTAVIAAQTGTVVHADWLGGYGKMIMIDHGGGIMTVYAHLNSFNVSLGQVVVQGAVIAQSGNTGRSMGPHLHFEVRKDGQYVNPLEYVKGK